MAETSKQNMNFSVSRENEEKFDTNIQWIEKPIKVSAHKHFL